VSRADFCWPFLSFLFSFWSSFPFPFPFSPFSLPFSSAPPRGRPQMFAPPAGRPDKWPPARRVGASVAQVWCKCGASVAPTCQELKFDNCQFIGRQIRRPKGAPFDCLWPVGAPFGLVASWPARHAAAKRAALVCNCCRRLLGPGASSLAAHLAHSTCWNNGAPLAPGSQSSAARASSLRETLGRL